MDERSPADSPTPCRVSIHHLTIDQVALLRSVLRSGDVRFGIIRGEVVAAAEFTDEVERAVAWAGLETESPFDAEFDDPEYRSDRPPLVKPSRPPLADGRRQATRWRRLSAGVLDEALVGVPTLLAHSAGAPPWTGAAMHCVYYVGPTMLYGWSIGKLWTGLRVVDRRSLRTPNPVAVMVRWLVAALPMLGGLFLGWSSDTVGTLLLVVYAPIMVNLRGLHDLAAGTLVVERSKAGPGIWVRHASPRQNA
jgi:uncharacterized RDD family membrane protein YckC